jgi:D-alanyl-D-alanine carboxypeptidase/D-alanyl-D-alanine-endopeptidase (penicillin-binding protein 4)
MTTIYMRNKWMVAALAALIIAGCGHKEDKSNNNNITKKSNIVIDQDMKQRLAELAHASKPRGAFGFYVFDLTADKPVYGCMENRAMSSASCLKLLSGTAGLHLLGTNYKYTTSLYTKGKMDNDTLRGSIALKADVEPQLNAPDMKMFAEVLKWKKIKKITGKVYLDLFIKEPVKSETHWYPWDLSFSKYGIFFKGADQVKKAFKMALKEKGIQIDDNQIILGKVPTGSHCVFRFYRTIERVIKRMWKNSSNTQATSLLYAIGHRVNPKGEPTKVGVMYLKKILHEEIGIKDPAIVIHDGCGLCTHNHMSPKSLVLILRYGYKHKDIYRLMKRYLSVAGVDGTARGLLNTPEMKGRIWAKTGTLSHPYGISSLAGFAQGKNGHMYAFAIMDNDMSVLDAHVLQKKLGQALMK